MVDLLRLPSATPPDRVDASAPSLAATPLTYAAISQAIFKLTDATALAQPNLAPLSAATLAAMQRLVDLITQLSQPDSGWSAELPQTPETLLPYVQDEAQDALDSLQAELSATAQTGGDRPHPDIEQPWHHYFSFKTLAPWLLWGTARSARDAMRLMEGTTATVLQPGQTWQTGILRLVVLLEVQTPDQACLLDLATHQPPIAVLSDDSLVQLTASAFCQQPTSIAEFVQQLVEQVQMATPAICPFMRGMPAEVLIPDQPWLSGSVHFHLAFEFLSGVGEVDPFEATTVNPNGEPGNPTSIAPSSPMVMFTNATWLEHHSTAIAQHQLATLLPQIPIVRLLRDNYLSPPVPPSTVMLVKDAHELTDRLRQGLAYVNCHALHQAMPLDDLALHLLWCFSRSTYSIMHLMGGIRVSLLQPQATWATGTLRLLVSLTVQTPEQDWTLDLMTGRPLRTAIAHPAADAIVQSNDSPWCQQPDRLEHLSNKVQQLLDQTAPEIPLLLGGTEVDLQGGDRQWQPGTIQLQMGFEFIQDIDRLSLS